MNRWRRACSPLARASPPLGLSAEPHVSAGDLPFLSVASSLGQTGILFVSACRPSSFPLLTEVDCVQCGPVSDQLMRMLDAGRTGTYLSDRYLWEPHCLWGSWAEAVAQDYKGHKMKNRNLGKRLRTSISELWAKAHGCLTLFSCPGNADK